MEKVFGDFSYIFLFDVNFEILTIRLHVLIISSLLIKFQKKNQKSISMLSIKCLNFKLWSKIKFIDQIINNILFE